MRTTCLISVFLLLGAGGWTLGLCQDMAAVPLDPVPMDTSAFETLKRPPVWFDHDGHNDAAAIEECNVCHHVWENGKRVPDESSEDSPCSDCHSLKPGPDNPVSLANAFHSQCRTCHIDEAKGPLLCGQCHKRRSKGE